jgi:hypothetical protein
LTINTITNLSPLLDTLSLMLHAELIHADTKLPVSPVLGSEGHLLSPLVGDLTSFVQRMNTNPEDELPNYKGVFAFNDLSVRKEGLYCLQFQLTELVGTDVIYRGGIESAPFKVFQPKEFPGMLSSTSCTEKLKKQGVKVRVKKSIRRPKGGNIVVSVPVISRSLFLGEKVASGTTSQNSGIDFRAPC